MHYSPSHQYRQPAFSNSTSFAAVRPTFSPHPSSTSTVPRTTTRNTGSAREDSIWRAREAATLGSEMRRELRAAGLLGGL